MWIQGIPKLIKYYAFQMLRYFYQFFYPHATLNGNGSLLCIPYIFQGKKYVLYVPFQRRSSVKMRNSSLYLMDKGQKVKMDVQPGVLPLWNAPQMGVQQVIVVNELENYTLTFEGTDKIVYV